MARKSDGFGGAPPELLKDGRPPGAELTAIPPRYQEDGRTQAGREQGCQPGSADLSLSVPREDSYNT